MSYWSTNTASTSAIEDLLSKEDVTLQEILEEAEVIQECKSQTKKLIDFLVKPDILRELIVLTTRVPADENTETVRYKYPSIACELLTCEIPIIIETIANKQLLLDELYSFIESDAPLNPLLASFFSRILGILVAKTSEQNWFSYQVSCLQVLEYLKSKGNCIALLLRHLGTSAIMDLIMKMYTKIEGDEIRENFLSWLDEEEFLEKLIAELNPNSCDDVLTNVCQLLSDLILSTRETGVKSADSHEPDCIMRKIESESYIKTLVEQMLLEPRCEKSIIGGISVLLILLGNQKREENPYSSSFEACAADESASARDNTINAIIPLLPRIKDLLHNPPQKPPVRTTVGTLEPALGATRVEVVRLMAALVSTGHEPLLAELQRLDLLNVLLDLFFQYPWNNFLHAQVEATLVAAFKYPLLVKHILTNCRIIQRVLDAWRDNDAQQKDKKPRRGYMGHVFRISNHVVEETREPHDAVLVEVLESEVLSQWQEFVGDALAKVNGDQSCPVGYNSKRSNDIENENYYAELYRRYYHLQALAPSFADMMICDEQQSSNQDEAMDSKELKPGFPDFGNDDLLAKQAELFSQVCSQKFQSLDDDADLWSSIIQNPTEPINTRAWNDDGSSDEEGTNGPEDDWPETTSVAPVEQSNPWSSDVLATSSPPDPQWANFDSSPFLANFSYELSSTIATSTPEDSQPVPFDLTPTEVPMFPAEEDDWASNSLPPRDWPISPPSELAQDEVPSESSRNETAMDENSRDTRLESDARSSLDEMETACVVESENTAEIVVASDIMNSLDPGTAETVIDQKLYGDAASQLAQLLAAVCVAAEPSMPNEGIDADAEGDLAPQPPAPSINNVSNLHQDAPKHNDDLNEFEDKSTEIVPKIIEKIAVNDDAKPSGISSNDVTTI